MDHIIGVWGNKAQKSTEKLISTHKVRRSLRKYTFGHLSSDTCIFGHVSSGTCIFFLDMCTQRRLRLACASAQSDQSHRCAPLKYPVMQGYFRRSLWSDCATAKAYLSLRWTYISVYWFPCSRAYSIITQQGTSFVEWTTKERHRSGFFRSQLIWICTVCKGRVYQGQGLKRIRSRLHATFVQHTYHVVISLFFAFAFISLYHVNAFMLYPPPPMFPYNIRE